MSDDINNPDDIEPIDEGMPVPNSMDAMPDPDQLKKEEAQFSSEEPAPSSPSMIMGGLDLGTAFTFPKDDPSWISKLLMGGLMVLGSFLIIPLFILLGWGIGIAENVMNGEKHPMPEWRAWGKFLRDGVNVFIAQLVYTLPFWLLFCIGMITTGIFSGSAQNGSDFATFFLGTTGLVLSCLGVLLAIAMLFITPAVIIQYIKSDRNLSACFQFSEVIGIARENMSTILVALLAIIVVQFGFSLLVGLLLIIPCLGWIAAAVLGFLAQPYFIAATNHLYGQIARDVVNYES